MNLKLKPYCGLACRRDLEDPDFIDLVRNLRIIKFVQFENTGWDIHWARRWEFPTVYSAIVDASDTLQINRVLESGSGITQVPFWLSMVGKEVTCVDLDGTLGERWDSFKKNDPDLKVNFLKGDMLSLPIDDDAFDLSYSISAIEHTGNAPKAIAEMIRVTKTGGVVVFTMDIDIQNSDSVSKSQFEKVQEILDAECDSFYPKKFFSPSELLTFNNRTLRPQSDFLMGLKTFLDRIKLYKLQDQTIFFYAGKKK